MNGYVAVMNLLPIVAFVIADSFFQQKKAIIAAIVISFISFVAYWAYEGQMDPTMLAEFIFLAILGAISLKWNNPTFFKYQPAVVGFGLTVFLAWFELRGESYLVKMVPRMVALNPSLGQVLNTPEMQARLEVLSSRLTLLLMAHACLMAYTARKKNSIWLMSRLAIYPAIIVLMVTLPS
ncbi:MAG: septation protein IspZ [Oligoflexales bacterium]